MNYRNFEDAFDLYTPESIEYNDENVQLKSFNPNKDVELQLAHISFSSGNLDVWVDIDDLTEIKTYQSVLTFLNKKGTCWIELYFEDEESMSSFLDVYANGL